MYVSVVATLVSSLTLLLVLRILDSLPLLAIPPSSHQGGGEHELPDVRSPPLFNCSLCILIAHVLTAMAWQWCVPRWPCTNELSSDVFCFLACMLTSCRL
ncbi:hypothetical protein B0H11DRAFT_1983415 [Mycena galericulata]|nr:hypothetical protein B0H11DRAFT_2008483 [Mycena galericulata]KAJ7504064.1 hypothetical protein B0H11DRAFT_1983415 [Mycena galericulata]